ncbi:MAG: response regulator [Candidatus Eremiobacteraeota bacterium]|nr:response regulator [Candidatus Eremiobacteraeota bacterium]
MATVLVVDDPGASRDLVKIVLTHAGHTVIEAADGSDGLKGASTMNPDLVLLDLSLPSMSGPEFARALRADPKTAATKVALYTATPMSAALRDFMEIYAIRHVVGKPSEPQELLAAIERALAG